MKSVGRIAQQAWMTASQTRAVLAALAADGAVVRFVGGCVRNTLADRPVSDIDLATTSAPAETVALLERAGLKAVATGLDHGTITAVAEGRPFEVTTLRRDAQTFGRKARVEYTDDWLADASRRDFTFNAMYCDPDGVLYDPFEGRADLAAGRVRFVGEASARIAEDYLRVFRFFRFLAWYGRPPADEQALAAIGSAAPLLTGLSGERVQKEMLRLLEAEDPVPAAAMMHREGVLVHWLPESPNTTVLAALVAIERANGLAPDGVRRLVALLAEDCDVDAIATRWKLSRAVAARIVRAMAPEPQIVGIGERPVRALVYRLGNETALDRIALHAARVGIGRSHPALAAALVLAEKWRAPRLPIGGDDVLALGATPGTEVGALLRAVENWWIEGDFAADRAACLAEVRGRMEGAE